MAHLVRDLLSVPGRPPAAQRVAAVLRPGVRIEQHPLGAVAAFLPVDDRLLLGGQPAGVEVARAAVDGRAQHVDVEQLGEAPRDRVAARLLAKPGAGEVVLRRHPGLHLRRLLVLEPPVGIGHPDAVQRLRGVGPPRGRVLRLARAGDNRGGRLELRRGGCGRRGLRALRRAGEEAGKEQARFAHGGAVCLHRHPRASQVCYERRRTRSIWRACAGVATSRPAARAIAPSRATSSEEPFARTPFER